MSPKKSRQFIVKVSVLGYFPIYLKYRYKNSNFLQQKQI